MVYFFIIVTVLVFILVWHLGYEYGKNSYRIEVLRKLRVCIEDLPNSENEHYNRGVLETLKALVDSI